MGSFASCHAGEVRLARVMGFWESQPMGTGNATTRYGGKLCLMAKQRIRAHVVHRFGMAIAISACAGLLGCRKCSPTSGRDGFSRFAALRCRVVIRIYPPVDLPLFVWRETLGFVVCVLHVCEPAARGLPRFDSRDPERLLSRASPPKGRLPHEVLTTHHRQLAPKQEGS